MERKKSVFNWSGGKDSAHALWRAMQSDEYEIVALLTTANRSTRRSTMHGIPESLLLAQAERIGVPLHVVDLAPQGGMEDYGEAMTRAVGHLPDARIATDSRDVCVLVIGESARRANFSLYGYGRPTNPLLERDSVTALMADAAATYTTAGVKAILDHKPTNKLYEILPNYLYRNGVDVVWRSANWGEPPLHIDKHYGTRELKARYPEADDRYDGILLTGLRDEILSSDKDKLLIVLHTSTSHGPTYYKKYPAGFEVFKPVCTTVEMSKADPGELMNAYDNTIVYTDYLIHSVIEILRDVPRRSCLIFVSDHGESLGEGNLYMHGVPMLVAPKEQIEIPFLVWTSDGELKADAGKQVGQYHVFHSILRFLGIDSPVYDESLDIFSPTEKE